jgi:alpha-L-fucosidase
MAGASGSDDGGAVTSESWTDNNLSRGRPASADSEQTTKQHYAADANDGDRSSRWCAADYKPNHYWEVDLGKPFSLSTLRILWEKDAGYLFKVESSVDHTSWGLVLDKTKSNSATANQQHSLATGAMGRYVRVTVTGGLSTTTWASFYELDVFGH